MPNQSLKRPINERPFIHTGRYGCSIEAMRCDLRGGVMVHVPSGTPLEQIVADVAQAFAWHGKMIHPDLDGFAGYDTISFKVIEVPR